MELLDVLRSTSSSAPILFAHAGIRPWDTRYGRFPNRSQIPIEARSSVDRDVILAINGPLDIQYLLGWASDFRKVAQVEALRFMSKTNTKSASRSISALEVGRSRRRLVLGDYSRETTEELVDLVCGAHVGFDEDYEIAFRPHPLAVVRDRDLMATATAALHSSLHEQLAECNVVVAPDTTSAVLSALLAGKPVCLVSAPQSLNFMQQLPGTTLLRNEAELGQFLDSPTSTQGEDLLAQLNLDQSLPRWLDLPAANTP